MTEFSKQIMEYVPYIVSGATGFLGVILGVITMFRKLTGSQATLDKANTLLTENSNLTQEQIDKVMNTANKVLDKYQDKAEELKQTLEDIKSIKQALLLIVTNTPIYIEQGVAKEVKEVLDNGKEKEENVSENQTNTN